MEMERKARRSGLKNSSRCLKIDLVCRERNDRVQRLKWKSSGRMINRLNFQ